MDLPGQAESGLLLRNLAQKPGMRLAVSQTVMRPPLKLALIVGLALLGAQVSTAAAQQRPANRQPAGQITLQEGDADLMLRLGYLYANGREVPHDEVKAAEWYRKASELGQTRAMYSLGTCYWAGRGVSQDYVEAYKWLEVVATRSVGPEQDWASTARLGLARVMSPAMVDEARKRAREWQSAFEKRKDLPKHQ